MSDPCVRTRLNTSPPIGQRQAAASGTKRERQREREREKESRTRQVARASVRLCATAAACVRAV